MKVIKINKVIDRSTSAEELYLAMAGLPPASFSLQSLQKIIDPLPKDEEIRIEIHSDGGLVDEGVAIYDYLRTSGRTIYTHIEGVAHSIATVILLAAPKENRSANPGSQALLHRARIFNEGQYTVTELEEQKKNLEISENTIIDIYADRTSLSKEEAKLVMMRERVHTAKELLDMGFISKITGYNTNRRFSRSLNNNLNSSKMSKKNKKKVTLLDRIENMLKGSGSGRVTNENFLDKDGNVVFSTAEGVTEIAIGDTVTVPDGVESTGSYELEDGRVVVLTEGVIEDIIEPEEVAEAIEAREEIIADLTNQVAARNELLREVKSNYKVAPRTKNSRGGKGATNSRADIIEASREAMAKYNKK